MDYTKTTGPFVRTEQMSYALSAGQVTAGDHTIGPLPVATFFPELAGTDLAPGTTFVFFPKVDADIDLLAAVADAQEFGLVVTGSTYVDRDTGEAVLRTVQGGEVITVNAAEGAPIDPTQSPPAVLANIQPDELTFALTIPTTASALSGGYICAFA